MVVLNKVKHIALLKILFIKSSNLQHVLLSQEVTHHRDYGNFSSYASSNHLTLVSELSWQETEEQNGI